MTDCRIGINLASIRQPFRKALNTAARLGAHAVELDARHAIRPSEMSQTGIRHLRKQLDDLNLGVSAVSFNTRYGYDTSENLDRRVAATKEAMSFAFQLGARVVTNHVGRVPEDQTEPTWSSLKQALEDIGSHAQRCGAWLCARTGTESGETLAELIKALPEGSLMVDLDPGAIIINGFSVEQTVTALGSHIAHVHARDGVRDLALGRGIEVQLGRGTADFPWILATLHEHRYAGFFTVERHQSADPIADLANGVQFLKSFS